jgi:hypothetical protein
MVRSNENIVFVMETRPPLVNGDGSEYKGIGNSSAGNDFNENGL